MHNLENKTLTSLWRPELLSDEEMYECLKETCWTARRAAYYVLGLKIPDLRSLEEEKKLCPDFEKYYELFESCFEEGRIAVHSFCSEYGKNVRAALPVDWLKLVHKGRLKDDAIEDKEVKREGLYVAPLLTEAWLLLQGKAIFAKRRPAQEKDDKLFAWSAARKLRRDFSQLSNRQMAQIIYKYCSKVQKYPFKTVYGWVIDSAIPMNEEPLQSRRDRNGRPKKDSYQKLSFDFSSYFNHL
jgi:hypothetical protein